MLDIEELYSTDQGATIWPKNRLQLSFLDNIHGQLIMGRHMKHFLEQRACPVVCDTAVASSDFDEAPRCRKSISPSIWTCKSCSLQFPCGTAVPQEFFHTIINFRALAAPWCRIKIGECNLQPFWLQ